ncbi:MAG: tetratricopeptide repeat protein [Candidatus Eiseniibacteriota bacterium]
MNERDDPGDLRSASIEVGPAAGSGSPQQIGPYRILEKIGEGGFGEIYAAQQTEPVKRRVALKVLKAGMDTKAVLARFEAERQALAMMDHPSIAKVLDAGETDRGRPFFVMDLVQGVPITEYCEKHSLSIRARLELFITVCQAVQHAHQKGIIHRDLKPSNILVTLADGTPRAKVIDFGIAKATTGSLSERTVYTQMGQLIGTPAYMSPEQAEMGALDIDTRADVYSLGVVLYELLTGILPFDPEALAKMGYVELRRVLREEEPARPSAMAGTRSAVAKEAASRPEGDIRTLTRRLKGELDWIVLKAMEKDRTRRYETANGFAMDIRRYLKDEPVIAGPPSAAYRFRKFAKRNKLVLGVVAAVLVTVTAALIESNRQRARVQAARDESDAVTGFLENMLTSVSPGELGRDVTVREVLDGAAKTIGDGFQDQPLIQARLRLTIGNTYRRLGEYAPAESLVEEALAARAARLSAGDPGLLDAMATLGELYRAQGRFDKAEAILAEALASSPDINGDNAEQVVPAMTTLSGAYLGQGKVAAAESLAKVVLDEGLPLLGEEHPEIRKAMNNLATMYVDQRRYEEAVKMLQRVLAVDSRTLGPEHPDVLLRMSNLAVAQKKQGDVAAAESLYVRVLEVRRRKLGETHPNVLTSKSNLAALWIEQGRFAEAEPMIEDVVTVTRATLPDYKGQLGNALAWQGECLRGLGRHDAAERALLEAHPLLVEAYGPTQERTVRAVSFLIKLYESRGDPARAASWRGQLAE